MGEAFSPPEFIPGCEVLSVADKDQYTTDNGWIEAICGQHNNQRCRWKAKFSGVQVGDYVDVLYFKSVQLFEVFAKGGSGNVSGLPITTKGDLLGYSTLPNRYPVSGNDGYVLTEDSGETFGFSWQAAGSGSWPYDKIITVSQTNAGADYSTIAAALAAVSAGDIILLDAGTYTETLTATTSCTVAGISAEDTIITSSGTTFTTGAGDITLENLTISTSSGRALVITTSSNFYGHNLIVSGTTDSIYSNSSTNIYLYNVRSSGGTYGYRMADSTGGVVYFYDGSYDGSTADIAFGDNGEGYFYHPIAQNEDIVFTTGTFDGIALTSNGNMLVIQDLVASVGQVLTKTATGQTWQDAAGGGWPFTNVLTVDPSDADADYTTITLAIAGASAGDAIWIGNATYSENVTVNKKLYLIGASREGVIIDGTFTTTTADCVIENLTIFRDDAGSSAVNIFTAGADATLRRVTLSGLTVTTTGALNGIYNVNSYEITAEDCTIELADASSSATNGVYVDQTSAIVDLIGGKIDAQSSGGTATDVAINEDGTINLRDPELVNNTLDAGGGTITGEYTSTGEYYRATLGTSIITAVGYSDPITPFASLPGLIGLWYGGNYQRSTGDMPNLAPYISGASSQDLSYNGTNHGDFDYLTSGVGYVDLNGTDNYFSVADNTDISITGTEASVANPGITWGGWFWFDNDTTAVDEYTICKFTDYYSRRLSATTTKFFSVIFDAAGANSNIASTNDVEHQQWVYLVSKFVPSTEVSNFVNDSKTTNAAGIVANCRNGVNALTLGAVAGGGFLDGRFSIGFVCASALNDATIQSIFQQTRSLYGV